MLGIQIGDCKIRHKVIAAKTMKISSLAIIFCYVLLLGSMGSVSSKENAAFPLAYSPPDIDAMLKDLDGWTEIVNQTLSKATIFFPTEMPKELVRGVNSKVIKYHVVPYALSFFHVKQFENGTRFPTLLHNKSILITSNDGTNFTIDGHHISHPDMFYDGKNAVHGVSTLLNYNIYGGNATVSLKPPLKIAPISRTSPPPSSSPPSPLSGPPAPGPSSHAPLPPPPPPLPSPPAPGPSSHAPPPSPLPGPPIPAPSPHALRQPPSALLGPPAPSPSSHAPLLPPSPLHGPPALGPSSHAPPPPPSPLPSPPSPGPSSHAPPQPQPPSPLPGPPPPGSSSHATPPPPSSLNPPVAPKPPHTTVPKIDAMFKDLNRWRNIIDDTKRATIFFPNTLSKNFLRKVPSSVIKYHVVPHALSFFDLKHFENGTRLPTLMHNKSILITSNHGSDFTIDGRPISDPDMFCDGKHAIHGVPNLLNYHIYGDKANSPKSPPSSSLNPPVAPKPPHTVAPTPAPEPHHVGPPTPRPSTSPSPPPNVVAPSPHPSFSNPSVVPTPSPSSHNAPTFVPASPPSSHNPTGAPTSTHVAVVPAPSPSSRKAGASTPQPSSSNPTVVHASTPSANRSDALRLTTQFSITLLVAVCGFFFAFNLLG